jgi:hypothetical protein
MSPFYSQVWNRSNFHLLGEAIAAGIFTSEARSRRIPGHGDHRYLEKPVDYHRLATGFPLTAP